MVRAGYLRVLFQSLELNLHLLLFDDLSFWYSVGLFCWLFKTMQKLWSDKHCKYNYYFIYQWWEKCDKKKWQVDWIGFNKFRNWWYNCTNPLKCICIFKMKVVYVRQFQIMWLTPFLWLPKVCLVFMQLFIFKLKMLMCLVVPFRSVFIVFDCHKTKIKVITLTNHNRCRQFYEPIETHSKYR